MVTQYTCCTLFGCSVSLVSRIILTVIPSSAWPGTGRSAPEDRGTLGSCKQFIIRIKYTTRVLWTNQHKTNYALHMCNHYKQLSVIHGHGNVGYMQCMSCALVLVCTVTYVHDVCTWYILRNMKRMLTFNSRLILTVIVSLAQPGMNRPALEDSVCQGSCKISSG